MRSVGNTDKTSLKADREAWGRKKRQGNGKTKTERTEKEKVKEEEHEKEKEKEGKGKERRGKERNEKEKEEEQEKENQRKGLAELNRQIWKQVEASNQTGGIESEYREASPATPNNTAQTHASNADINPRKK